ncbi:MAG: pyridoxal phosphate-dependent aminotransferase [Candidatus Marinamargulisbacteria bacterium]
MTTFQLEETNLRPISHSETLLINEAQDNLKKTSDKKIYKFGFGQSPFSPPISAVESLKNYAPQHDYLPVAGLDTCRNAVAKAHENYRPNISGDDVVIAPGSKMIIYSVMACYQNATVILPQPSWVSYAPQASLLNHDVVQIPTNFELKWKITPANFDAICKNITNDSQKILVLNYPGNPTGMTYTPEELVEIATVARNHQVLVISDEIYGWLDHEGNHRSIAEFYPEGTFVTTGLSKWCGAGGWRFGAGIFPENASKALKVTYNGIASETYSTTAAPVQFAATDIYNNMSELSDFINSERVILKGLAKRIVDLLKNVNVNIHMPDGGFYIFPDFSFYKDALKAKGIDTAEKFCVALLNEEGVAMLPASAFGFDETHFYSRMCYVDFDGTAAIKAYKSGKELNDEFYNTYTANVIEGITALCDYLKRI